MNSPYIVTGDIYVDDDDSLTIEAGVDVKFLGNYSINIRGYFSAVGTQSDSVRFMPYHSPNLTRGMWGGIYALNADYPAKSITLRNFSIAYGGSSSGQSAALAIQDRYLSLIHI